MLRCGEPSGDVDQIGSALLAHVNSSLDFARIDSSVLALDYGVRLS